VGVNLKGCSGLEKINKITVPNSNTCRQVEYMKAKGKKKVKELGKFTLYLRKKECFLAKNNRG